MSLAAATLLWPRESTLRSLIFALHCLPTPGTCSLQTARKALQFLQNTSQAAIARAVTASQFRWIPLGLQPLTSSDCCLCSVGALFVAQQTTVRWFMCCLQSVQCKKPLAGAAFLHCPFLRSQQSKLNKLFWFSLPSKLARKNEQTASPCLSFGASKDGEARRLYLRFGRDH